MKKWILLISCVLLLLFSCMKKESMNSETKVEEFSISLRIPNNLILDEQSVEVLIHDQDGALIERRDDIDNKSNHEFTIQNEYSPVLFSLVFKTEGGIRKYRIKSFLIEEAINLTLGDYTNRNLSKSRFKLFDESDKKWNFLTSSSSLWGDGTGTISTLQPRFFPPNELISFTDGNTGLRKVVNIIDPQENQIYVIDSLEIKDIIDSTTYLVNEPGWKYSTLYGRRMNLDERYIRLSRDDDETSPMKMHYLPIDSINDFLLHTEVESSTEFFGVYDLKSSFDLNFSRPEIDFVLNEVSVNRLNITSSNAHFVKTTLENYNQTSTLSGYRLSWEINGEIDEVAEINFPNIDNYMLEMESNYSPEKLMPSSTSIYKTQQQWSYDQFISFSVESIVYYNIPSSLEHFSLKH